MTFALFGKPFRKIVMGGLINSVNGKDCLVEIEFITNGKEYKVVRGIKPKVFEIYCDGTLLNKDSAVRDYQEYLEKYILRMNYKTFTQIVILGSSSYTKFMELSASDRRTVIENLLDIQVFSSMNVIVKQRLVNNKKALETVNINIKANEDKKTFIEKTIASLKQNNEEVLKDLYAKFDEISSDIDDLNLAIDKFDAKKAAHENKISKIDSLNKKHRNYISLRSSLQTKLDHKLEHLNFYQNNEDCPTCKQEIHSSIKQKALEDSEEQILEYQEAIKKIDVSIDACLTEIDEANKAHKMLTTIEQTISVAQSKISNLLVQKKDLLDRITKTESADKILVDNETELENTLSELKKLEQEKIKLLDDRLYIDTSIELLKDGGIKTKIIKQYLPLINKSINKHLKTMEFFVDFNIDESFEETIRSRYRDEFKYQNFSEGEKARINLALLFTWRTIAKMRNSCNTNLLFMDETCDSSLDTVGVDSFMEIINSLKDTNVFVISHREQMFDKFQKTYIVEKKSNFSRITEHGN